jgi:tryptophanase
MIRSSEKEKVLHQPKLNTIKMVEIFIKDHSGEYKKRALWEHLPKKMMYQTYCVIIDYLMESGKIAMDREGTIAWTWNPGLVKYYLEHEELIIRK